MAGLKESGQAVGAEVLTRLTGFAPPTVLQQAARLQTRQRLFNLTVTNVPGPQYPLYLLGRRMRAFFPRCRWRATPRWGSRSCPTRGRSTSACSPTTTPCQTSRALAADLDAAIAKLAVAAGVRPTRPAAGHRRLSRMRSLAASSPWGSRAVVVAVGALRRSARATRRRCAPARARPAQPDKGGRHLEGGERAPTPPASPPTSGPHRAELITRDRQELSDDEVLHALALGDVVLGLPRRAAAGGARGPAEDLAGRFDAELAAAGQSVVLVRRPGVGPVTGAAWRRLLRADGPDDPRLRAFAEHWLAGAAPVGARTPASRTAIVTRTSAHRRPLSSERSTSHTHVVRPRWRGGPGRGRVAVEDGAQEARLVGQPAAAVPARADRGALEASTRRSRRTRRRARGRRAAGGVRRRARAADLSRSAASSSQAVEAVEARASPGGSGWRPGRRGSGTMPHYAPRPDEPRRPRPRPARGRAARAAAGPLLRGARGAAGHLDRGGPGARARGARRLAPARSSTARSAATSPTTCSASRPTSAAHGHAAPARPSSATARELGRARSPSELGPRRAATALPELAGGRSGPAGARAESGRRRRRRSGRGGRARAAPTPPASRLASRGPSAGRRDAASRDRTRAGRRAPRPARARRAAPPRPPSAAAARAVTAAPAAAAAPGRQTPARARAASAALCSSPASPCCSSAVVVWLVTRDDDEDAARRATGRPRRTPRPRRPARRSPSSRSAVSGSKAEGQMQIFAADERRRSPSPSGPDVPGQRARARPTRSG